MPRWTARREANEGSRPFYEPLAYYGPDGNLVPVLAAEIPSRANGGIAADGRSTTWKLKPGVSWHDGAPFGADDVIFNWQYATDLATAAVTPAVFFSSDLANPDTSGKFWADLQMFTFTRIPDLDRFMQQFVSWEASSKANKWQGLNQVRWANEEYGRLFRASEVELDPVKRAALFIRMNDLVSTEGHVLPVVVRPDVSALARTLAAPLTGWDIGLAALHDWYRTG